MTNMSNKVNLSNLRRPPDGRNIGRNEKQERISRQLSEDTSCGSHLSITTAVHCTALHCSALHYPRLYTLHQTRLQCAVVTYLYSSGRIIGGRLVDFTPHMESCTVLYHTWRAVLYSTPHGEMYCTLPHMESCTVLYPTWRNILYSTTHREWRHYSLLLSAAQHCTQCIALISSTTLHTVLLYYTALCCTLHYTALHCVMLLYTVLYCTVHYTTLLSTLLWSTALH